MTNFRSLLQLIKNGDPVDQATINQPLRSLLLNDKYLLDLINALTSGSAVFRRGASVAAEVSVGQPVYYNAQTRQFERGLAAATVVSGTLRTDMSAQIWGICYFKHNSTSADILLQGYAEVDISAALAESETVTAGLYYLSGSVAGRLTTQEPPVSVPVLQADGVGGVFVNCNFSDLVAGHQHYKFDLNCITAGTPVLDAGRFTITDADTDVIGWLPADHAVFDGHAPAGAKFGYNIGASSFANAWPPLPTDGATLEWFNGSALLDPEFEGFAVIDRYGIWWMTDCEDWCPWPVDYVPAVTTVPFDPSDCPVSPPMALRLWYTRPKFHSTGTVVTSLAPKAGSVITIRCTDGDNFDQRTGNLEIDADLALLLEDSQATPGHIALKGISNGKFTRGPVISRLKPGDDNVLLSSTGGADTDGYHVGDVTVSVLSTPIGRELDVQTIRLQGATEENYDDIIAVGFPTGRLSSFRGELHVPYSTGADSLTVALRFWILARATGTLPPLTLTVREVLRPDPVTAAVALPTADAALALTMPGGSITEDSYVEVTSASFTVQPGSVVYFSLSRDDSAGDGFDGEVHIIRQSGVILGA